ncbi:HalOD1 output domain-containing protein [Salinarchaeum laminariae]|mgnify:CR=1 FL=1|uniref:HalOD1 output domain-containing protein n=1 Tax=Salinarchaeum laminariae TaxID=869888 RepID=UPI0020BE4CED|nr:HalOD1 output domain-containing protein [Salinarchaeum laminariae]
MSSIVDRQPIATTTVDDSATTSVTVCEAVSDASGTPVRELPPLRQSIDADSLDDLFASTTAPARLSFQFAGYDVVTRSSGEVELYRVDTVTR